MFARFLSRALAAADRAFERMNVVPTFIRRSVEHAGLPLEAAYVLHVVLFIAVNHASANVMRASKDIRVAFTPSGHIDWARSGFLHANDCFLDLKNMMTVDATSEYARVTGQKRVMPAKWCIPPTSAEKLVAEEGIKLERLTNFMKDEATLHGLRVLGAIEVNVNVHAILLNGQLMLNPRVVGLEGKSECTVEVLGVPCVVSYYKKSNIVFQTFFGGTVTQMLTPMEACTVSALTS
jgi:hypothetical protein